MKALLVFFKFKKRKIDIKVSKIKVSIHHIILIKKEKSASIIELKIKFGKDGSRTHKRKSPPFSKWLILPMKTSP